MELCPACGQISNMVASTSTRTVETSSGERKAIKTISFQCEQCHQFIRSEDKEEAE
jgi:phage terminase large subunit GpA-like protein